MKVAKVATLFAEVPSKTALGIFTQGCSLHCEGCQTPELQVFNSELPDLTDDDFRKLLRDRKSLCSWLVWLGGEPTEYPIELEHFSKVAVEEGYQVALYTGRVFDKQLENLFPSISFLKTGPWKGIPVINDETNQRLYFRNSLKAPFRKISSWNCLKKILEVS